MSTSEQLPSILGESRITHEELVTDEGHTVFLPRSFANWARRHGIRTLRVSIPLYGGDCSDSEPQGKSGIRESLIPDPTAAASPATPEPTPGLDWLSVTEAARQHAADVDGYDPDDKRDLKRLVDKISEACNDGKIVSVGRGKGENGRRIDPVSFKAWRLDERDRDLSRQDDES